MFWCSYLYYAVIVRNQASDVTAHTHIAASSTQSPLHITQMLARQQITNKQEASEINGNEQANNNSFNCFDVRTSTVLVLYAIKQVTSQHTPTLRQAPPKACFT